MIESLPAMMPPFERFTTYSVGLVIVMALCYVLFLGRAPLIRRSCFVVAIWAMILAFVIYTSGRPKASLAPLVFGILLNLAPLLIGKTPLKKSNPHVKPDPGLWDQEMDR